jgi:hypothetical protein
MILTKPNRLTAVFYCPKFTNYKGIKMPAIYTKNPDGTFSEVVTQSAIDTATSWITDRSLENSTKVGVIAGAAAAPTIADNAGKAVIAGLAGDYISCAMYGVPALVGIVGSLAAIIKPDNKLKGPTNDQIKSHVAALSRDELISLLQSTGTPSVMQSTGTTIQL